MSEAAKERVPGGKTFRSLRTPNYRIYLTGSVVSNTGTWMMRVAQDWLVLKPLHAGSGQLGIVTGLQFLPILLFTPYAGTIADRFPKRALLQLTQTVMGFFSLLAAVFALSGHSNIWLVYLCAFGLGVGAAFDTPARQAFVSEMVPREDLANAVGLGAASFNVARLLGPAISGLLIAWWGGGQTAVGAVFAVNAVSYLAVIGCLRAMDPALLHSPDLVPRRRGSIIEGVRYVRHQPKMVYVLVAVVFAGAFGMNFQLTSALMATQVFHKGAGEFGVLGSMQAIGSLAGALLAARRRRITLTLLVVAGLSFGVLNVVAGSMPSYLAFAIVSPFIGFAMLTMLNGSNATMQLETEPEMRGRVMALYFTVNQGSTPIGSPIIGWVGDSMGPRWTLWLGGVLTIVGVFLGLGARRSTITQNSEAAAELEDDLAAEPGAEFGR